MEVLGNEASPIHSEIRSGICGLLRFSVDEYLGHSCRASSGVKVGSKI